MTEPAVQSEPAHVTILVEGEHGTVSPSGELTVEPGGNQTVYFYPDEGYAVDKVVINGVEVDGSSGSYTVENIEGGLEISVTFKPIGDFEKACSCVLCAFWHTIFSKLGCVCPWCWLILLLVILTAVVLVTCRLKKRKKKQAD